MDHINDTGEGQETYGRATTGKSTPASTLSFYSDCGFAVVPYDTNGKKRIGNFGKGVAPQSRVEVEKIFEQNPSLNIGMVPGVDGRVVVDFDVKRKPADGGRQIETDPSFLHMPETPTVKTPSGGKHFHVNAPAGLQIKTKLDIYEHHPVYGIKGTGIRRKVDLLASNHAGAVLPPSNFGQGAYEWEPGKAINTIETAPFPLRLLLIPNIHQQTYDKGQQWVKAVEDVRLCDGDYRNGVLVSFISELFYVLVQQHGNSLDVARAASIAETKRMNKEFSQPLPQNIVEGIIERFDKDYSRKPAWLENSSEDKENSGEPDRMPKDGRKSQAACLIELVESEDVELFHDDLQEPHARVEIDGHFEIQKLDSRTFKRYLSKLYWDKEKKAIGNDGIKNALNVLEAKAVHEGAKYTLWNRVAWHEGAIWYDLSDREHRAVRIDAHGWQVIDHPPILFQRYNHHRPQVLPESDGNAWVFLDFFRLSDEGSKLLLLVTTICHLIPDIPHVVLMVHGSHGAAKTTSLRFVKRVVDPSVVETIGPMEDGKDFAQVLSHNYFVVMDNLSKMSDALSDTLCRAVTGNAGFKRTLFTTDDDYIYRFKRCIGINGITAVAEKTDLLERGIHIALERITDEDRKEESDLWPNFEAALPSILGGMFDVLSRAMALKPTIKLKSNFRMADFASWGCAIAEAFGINRQKFLDAYGENRGTQNEEIVDEEPVAVAMIAFAKHKELWEGTSTQLLILLNHQAMRDKIDKSGSWPTRPNKLSQKLTELSPTLATVGVYITKIRKRTYLIKYLEKMGASGDQGDQDDSLGIFEEHDREASEPTAGGVLIDDPSAAREA